MKQKGKALKWFVLFLVFMLVCGIISRGIYAEQMPRVTTARMQERELDHTVKGEGIVEAKEEKPLVLPSGLPVASVYVRKGQQVEAGDVLFYLDVDGLKKLYEETEENLKLAQSRLSDYQAGVAERAKTHQTNLNRANEDYNNINSSTANDVSHAEQAYQSAKDDFNHFPSFDEYKNQAIKKDDTYQKLQKKAKKEKATAEDKDAFEEYKVQFESTLESLYQQEKQALQDAITQREAELASVRKDQEERMQAASRALEDAKVPETVEQAAGMELQKSISELKEQSDMYQTYLEAEGAVLSEESGYISEILVEAGGMTGENGVMVLSILGDTLYFTGNIAKEDKKYVIAGDSMSISFGNRYLSDIPVLAVAEAQDGGYQVTVEIPSEGHSIGENGSFSLVRKTQSYQGCVPLEALHSEDFEDYVYYIEEQDTILGTELVAKKRKVKVLDKDEEFAALEGNPFTDEELLIVEADKEFSTGTRVRIDE